MFLCQIIRCNNAIQCLACICNLAACFIEDLRDGARCLNHVAHCVFCRSVNSISLEAAKCFAPIHFFVPHIAGKNEWSDLGRLAGDTHIQRHDQSPSTRVTNQSAAPWWFADPVRLLSVGPGSVQSCMQTQAFVEVSARDKGENVAAPVAQKMEERL